MAAGTAQGGEEEALPAWLHHHRVEVEPTAAAAAAATVFPMARSATEAGGARVSLVGELVPPGGFSQFHAQHDERVNNPRRLGGVFGGRGSAVDFTSWAGGGGGGGGGGSGGALT